MISWFLQKVMGTKHERELKRVRPMVAAINEIEPKMQALSDAELKAKTGQFREQIANGKPLDDLIVPALDHNDGGVQVGERVRQVKRRQLRQQRGWRRRDRISSPHIFRGPRDTLEPRGALGGRLPV